MARVLILLNIQCCLEPRQSRMPGRLFNVPELMPSYISNALPGGFKFSNIEPVSDVAPLPAVCSG